jgi:predicted ATPase
MIQSLEIQNFKSHKNTCLQLDNLTVLCGANAVGKSSAVHPLLLLRESFLNKTEFEYIDLLCNAIKIGTAKDAIYQFSKDDYLRFVLSISGENYEFNFEVSQDLSKTLINQLVEKPNKLPTEILKLYPIFNADFHYVSAARLGAQSFYPKDDVVVEKYKQMSVIEGKAE